MSGRLTRRGFVHAGGLAAAGGLATAATAVEAPIEAAGGRDRPAAPRAAPRLPLRRDAPVFALVQSPRRDVDPAHAPRDLAANLAALHAAVAAAQSHGPRKDWIAFHDAALTGRSPIALDRDGPEFVAVAGLARRHACWLSVGVRVLADARDPLDAVAFFSPAGELASLQPADGARALGPGLSLVAVTELGNLAATLRADDPLLDAERVEAGAEFLLRAHSGPLADWALDVPVCCRAHRIHGAVVAAAQSPGTPPCAVDVTAGGTAFYGPDGRRLAGADDGSAQHTVLAVPLAAQRTTPRTAGRAARGGSA